MPISLSGSLVITGSITTTGVITMSGSIASASYSSTSDLLQGTGSVGFTTTASFNAVSSSQQQVSASYISLSGSYNTFSGSASTRITANSASIQQVSSSQQQISASLLNVISIFATTGSNSFRANQSITGSLVVSSTITAQTLVVQTVTSSIVYSSGSNIFGCDLNSRQTFTGSVLITGSLNTAGTITATTIYGSTAVCAPLFVGGIINGSGFCTSGGIVGNNSNNLYLSSNSAAGEISFWGNQLNTRLMTLTGCGSLGIGTNIVYSGAKLHILGGILAVEPTNGNTNSEILVGRGLSSLGTSAGSGITAKVNFAFEGSNDNFYQELGFITTTANQTRINSTADFYISTKAAGSSSPTERMRITSCGKVGILATDPKWLLEICYNTTDTGGGGYPAISINNPNDAGYSAYYFFKGSTNMGGMELSNATCHLFINTNCIFTIKTNNTERLRVTNCGGVVVGSCLATPTGAENGWWVKVPNEPRAYFSSTTEALAINRYGSTGIMLAFDYVGTGKGNISTNGSAISYNTTSDYRLKEDLKEVCGLDKISAIKVYDFKWKNSDNRMDGVLAHELQQILPYAVIGEKDAEQMQGVDYSKLAPVLVKAIQEQQCTICSQASRITLLESCLGIS